MMEECNCKDIRTFADYLKTQEKIWEDESYKIDKGISVDLNSADYRADVYGDVRTKLIESFPQCFSKEEYNAVVSFDQLVQRIADIVEEQYKKTHP